MREIEREREDDEREREEREREACRVQNRHLTDGLQ